METNGSVWRIKRIFFKKFLVLPNGIPSEDTINRIFSSIDNLEFESCFMTWINSISSLVPGQVIGCNRQKVG